MARENTAGKDDELLVTALAGHTVILQPQCGAFPEFSWRKNANLLICVAGNFESTFGLRGHFTNVWPDMKIQMEVRPGQSSSEWVTAIFCMCGCMLGVPC